MRRIVTKKRLRDYAEAEPRAAASLLHWEKTVLAAMWENPLDVKLSFNDVDRVRVGSGNTVHVFNIQRNEHRLIAAIHFKSGLIFVLRIMSHREYDLGHWKAEL